MLRRLLSAGLLSFFLIGLYACENEGPVERTGENVRQDVEEFGEDASDFPEEAEDNVIE